MLYFIFILAPTMLMISYLIVENSDQQLKTIFPILITITNLLIGNYFSKTIRNAIIIICIQ